MLNIFSGDTIIANILDLRSIIVEYPFHAAWNIIWVKGAGVGVAEDFLGGVVAADDDVAAVVVGSVKDIIGVVAALGGQSQLTGGWGTAARSGCLLVLKEDGGLLPSLLRSDRVGMAMKGRQQ